jgi:hypothetical protein
MSLSRPASSWDLSWWSVTYSGYCAMANVMALSSNRSELANSSNSNMTYTTSLSMNLLSDPSSLHPSHNSSEWITCRKPIILHSRRKSIKCSTPNIWLLTTYFPSLPHCKTHHPTHRSPPSPSTPAPHVAVKNHIADKRSDLFRCFGNLHSQDGIDFFLHGLRPVGVSQYPSQSVF